MDTSDMFLKALSVYSQGRTSRELASLNEKTARYGISITQEEAKQLAESNKFSLAEHSRFEFGKSAVIKIAERFAESTFVHKREFTVLVAELTDHFYLFKNEVGDKVGDDDIIDIMFEYFDKRCGGSTELLMNRYFDSIVNFEKIEDCDIREFVPDEFD